MSESTIAQKTYYIREERGSIQCYIEQKDHFIFAWCEPEFRVDKKLKHLTMVYHIEGKGIYDGIYTRNGSLENLAFLFMLKIVKRLGVKRCLSKQAPPDKARADIFMSIEKNGIVAFYKGSSGFLKRIGTYTPKQFLAVKQHYTHAYYSGDIGLYLRNNHLVKLIRDKVNNDARKKEGLTQTA